MKMKLANRIVQSSMHEIEDFEIEEMVTIKPEDVPVCISTNPTTD